MWLHFLIFAYILFMCIISKNIHNNRCFVFCIFLFFFILAAFRNISVGNDTAEYYRVFNLISKKRTIASAMQATRYEVGYILLNYIVTRFTTHFTVLLAIISAIYLFSVFKFIKRYSDSLELSVVLFFTMSSYYVLMNLERQCLAVAIILWAFSILEEKKYVVFVFLVLLAASFQTLAIVYIIFPFLPKINMGKSIQVFKWIVICFLSLIFIDITVQRVLIYFPYYQHYFSESIYGFGGIRSASLAFFGIRFSILVMIYLVGGFRYQRITGDGSIELLNKMMILDCMIAAVSITFNMYDRLEGYVCLGYVISITNAIANMKNIINKKIIIFLFVGITFTYATLTILLRSDWSGIFPYSFMNWR